MPGPVCRGWIGDRLGGHGLAGDGALLDHCDRAVHALAELAAVRALTVAVVRRDDGLVVVGVPLAGLAEKDLRPLGHYDVPFAEERSRNIILQISEIVNVWSEAENVLK